MRIRKGFVSNSSSSSFLLIASFEDFEKALKKMKEEHAKFLRDIVGIANFRNHSGNLSIAIIDLIHGDESRNDLYSGKGFLNTPKDFDEDLEDGRDGVGSILDEYVEALKSLHADYVLCEDSF